MVKHFADPHRKLIVQNIFILTAIFLSLSAPKPDQEASFLGPQQVNALPSVPADQRIHYGSGAEQFGELRLPRGVTERIPVAVVLHGGCWKANHGNLMADVENTAPLASALTSLGIATWNLEYRRIDQRGGGWPGTFQDVAGGVEYLRVIAASYPLDLSHVVIIGHSSGGHLGTWVAARNRLSRQSQFFSEHPLPIVGVVNLAGPADLESMLPVESKTCGGPVIERLVGGSPEAMPERYAEVSPAQLLPLGVPQILITGNQDKVVPFALAKRYEDTARAKGDPVHAIVVANAAHFEVIAPDSTAWRTVREAVLSMVQMPVP